MNLVHDIASLPLWLSGLLLVIIPTAIVMCGPLIVRRLFSFDQVVINNEVAGFKFATLGVVYAVLLGLAVIAVWEKFSAAHDATAREAGALAAMYRLSAGIAPPGDKAIRDVLTAYGRAAIDNGWPAMTAGEESPESRIALDKLYTAILALPIAGERDAVLLETMLGRVNEITDARRERLALSEGVVPNVIWLVLFTGAIMVLGFTFFFGLQNLRVQMLMTGMLAVVIFLALFVALSISHPFTGPVAVSAEPIELVVEDFAKTPPD